MGKTNSSSFLYRATLAVSALVTPLLFQNCSNVRFAEKPTTSPAPASVASTPLTVDPVPNPPAAPLVQLPAPVPPAPVVCSAFENLQNQAATEGLKAELRYLDRNFGLTNDQAIALSAADYFNDADPRFLKAPDNFYFSDVNVPSRQFDSGFKNSKGELLLDNQGNTLVEFFGLRYETEFKLGKNDLPGYYEIATVSDDGTIVEMKKNGIYQRIISNDGGHAPKMGCSDSKIFMDQQSRIPLRITYNQGQRMLIANVLFKNYRGPKLQTDPSVSSDLAAHNVCGVENFWDFWNPFTSEPQSLISEIQSAGWKTMASDNFQIPNNKVNPCVK